MSDDAWAIRELCEHFGIATFYNDISGRRCEVSLDSQIAFLAEFGVSMEDGRRAGECLSEIRRRASRSHLPPVLAIPTSAAGWSIRLRLPATQYEVQWTVTEEAGAIHEGREDSHAQPELSRVEIDGVAWCEREIPVRLALPEGYHRLQVSGMTGETVLVRAPDRCYRPEGLRSGGRIWGASIQLYSLRSKRNWGMGDFTDLVPLIELMAARGAGIIGLNPLHALFPHNPGHLSPYSPSSRQHLNVLYIDVEAVEGFRDCEEAVRLVGSKAFQERLRGLREANLVDAAGVAAAKFEVLEVLFSSFRELRLANDGRAARDASGQAFLDFVSERGLALERHALFEALQEHLHTADSSVGGLADWPAAFRDPKSPEVEAFARDHFDRVQYFEYLQWLASIQLERASQRCRSLGLSVGLYFDIAVSFDRAGADAWSARSEVASGAAVGAPPDAFALSGQDWGLPPLRPDRQRETGYRLFIDTLRANMRGAGAVRIDHVMGLMRLFWIPPGRRPRDGAYVHYPLAEMMSIVALESQRNRCMVIGEDLGTVADEMREALTRFDVLSYRLLYFERQDGGDFLPPSRYPEAALVAVTTHDLPPVAAWWSEEDLRLRESLGLFPDRATFEKQRQDRTDEKARLIRAIRDAGLLSAEEGEALLSAPTLSGKAVEALHAYVARTPSAVMVVQLEDLLGVTTQVNLPGTVDEHPNWRQKLPTTVEQLAAEEKLDQLAEVLRGERGALSP